VTPQAATHVSPAQVLYAQNPAVNADHYAHTMGDIDYDDPEIAAPKLLFRASVAAKLGAQAAENIKLAHARNAARSNNCAPDSTCRRCTSTVPVILFTHVAERLGVWASACTSDCRNTVDTGGVSPATAGRWHSSRVRPQCPDPGQLERETQDTAPPQIHRIGIPRCRSA
jgi:hypothetical protein